MLRRFLIALCMVFGFTAAYAGPAANIEYVHKMIAHVWGIDVPYNTELKNPKFVANMKYLLTAVDAANRQLNGVRTSDYSNTEYATTFAADTITTNTAVQELVRPIQYHFTATTTETSDFSFKISAKGTFYVDWGDGKIEKIEKTDGNDTAYSHTYDEADVYNVRFAGKATGYESNLIGAITFTNNTKLAKVEGSVGRIFSTLANGVNPSFRNLFDGCTNLTGEIPENLFDGVTGQPQNSMFSRTFYNAGFTGSIPENLFAGLSGTGQWSLFYATFYGCKNLTGSIPAKLFAGLRGAPVQNMFSNTFSGCTGLSGEIPENLFTEYDADGNLVRGIQGAPAYDMFTATFMNCTGLSGKIPAKLFAGARGAPAGNMFLRTFQGCTGLTGEIPSTLFAGINGAPAGQMFYATFYGCSGLTMIPENLFAGVKGKPAKGMFVATFQNCTGLSWDIPAALFAGITGTPAQQMFDSTFAGCTNVTGFEDALFAGISGTPAPSMFKSTFSGCTGLAGTIPANMFGSVSGTPAANMFDSTFANCKKLTKIGGALFSGIDGAPASAMFKSTFQNCSGLTGSIPSGLFGTFDSAPAYQMFAYTFSGCSGLSGSIPQNLFAGVKGAPAGGMYQFVFDSCTGLSGEIPSGLFGEIQGEPASSMYASAFRYCWGLNGSIPAGLFGDLSGSPATWMFDGVFYSCFGLTGEIPENLFGKLSGNAADKMFSEAMAGCTGLSGYSAKSNGKYLYEIWPNASTAMYHRLSNLTDYPCIPTSWGGAGGTDVTQCMDYPFSVTTDSISEFSFNISAMGKFYVDWGDGTGEVIEKADVTDTAYSHTYSAAGAKTIRVAGLATDYNDTTDGVSAVAAISFANNANITSVSGDLGSVFPVLADGTGPRFYRTFAGNKKLTTVPDTLFSGITAPYSWMFGYTFRESGLTEIPENLFATVVGSPKETLFYQTFGATPVESVPGNLFSSISGDASNAANMFGGTFAACPNIKTFQPGMFANLSGNAATSMFESFCQNCTGLESVPAEMFTMFSGTLKYRPFGATFAGCKKLKTIGAPLFGDHSSGTPCAWCTPFGSMFEGCTSLTGDSAKMRLADGSVVYPYDVVSYTGDMNTYLNATGLNDWKCMPSNWGGGGGAYAECQEDWDFNMTTGSISKFSITTSAAGTFYVDWGDGKFDTIKKTDTTSQTVSHTYDTAAARTIRMAGQATGYLDGTPAVSFANTSGITGIDGSIGKIFPTLADGTNPSFMGLFEDANNLASEIPEELFDGITGQPVPYMFANLFYGCGSLTDEIPAGLFAGLDGTPVDSLFDGTFWYAGVSGDIPSGLFAGIKGAPAPFMFFGTFANTFVDDVPGDLFAGISGAPANDMFGMTFYDTGLTKLPEGLFAGIKGAPAERMYGETFFNNVGIKGEIPLGFFGDISGPGAEHMFYGTFRGCGGLTGYSARDKNGEFLYNIWPEEDFGRYCYSQYYQRLDKLTDYDCIPGSWGGPATGTEAKCIGNWPLTMTVEGSRFAMDFAVDGQVFVDWGDGTYETYDDGLFIAEHNYSSSGTYNVRLAARPTAYYGDEYPTLKITTPAALVGIQGSLGEVFPTLADGSNPVFSETFAGTINLTTVPETLFSGITGTARPYMFFGTFMDSGLTEIPTYLFAGITTPAESMFESTFDNCTALKTIPENLFLDLQLGQTPPANMFKYMFAGCSGLHGESAKISGMYLYDEYADTEGVFEGMYLDCAGLTDYAHIPMSWKSQAE